MDCNLDLHQKVLLCFGLYHEMRSITQNLKNAYLQVGCFGRLAEGLSEKSAKSLRDGLLGVEVGQMWSVNLSSFSCSNLKNLDVTVGFDSAVSWTLRCQCQPSACNGRPIYSYHVILVIHTNLRVLIN